MCVCVCVCLCVCVYAFSAVVYLYMYVCACVCVCCVCVCVCVCAGEGTRREHTVSCCQPVGLICLLSRSLLLYAAHTQGVTAPPAQRLAPVCPPRSARVSGGKTAQQPYVQLLQRRQRSRQRSSVGEFGAHGQRHIVADGRSCSVSSSVSSRGTVGHDFGLIAALEEEEVGGGGGKV